MRLPPAAAALCALVSGTAAAQAIPPPRLLVRAAERPITIAALDVRVVIQGLAAETTQTVTFHNPNARVLEGELEFPLPDGAAVIGYALDVEGKLVDGVVVPRQQARVILEAEIRRGVDPGLVEHVRGNVYRTRVYPIPAGGHRTVRLRWISPLTVDARTSFPPRSGAGVGAQGADATYRLPLPYRERVPQLALRVEVVRPPVTPEVKGGFGNLTLARQGDRWVAEARLTDAPADRDLLVRLPTLPASMASVEVAAGGEAFFSVTAAMPFVEAEAPPPGPRRIALAWDASGSRGAAATGRELELLRQLLSAWSRTAVDVVVFRDRPERPVAFGPGEWAKLDAFLRGLPADGGTGLAALDLRRSALPAREDALWLLLSDGLATLGEALPPTDDVPVWAASGAGEVDRALLRHVTEATGGRLLDLSTGTPGAAVSVLRGPQARVARVTATPAGAVADLQRRDGAAPDWVTVTGRLVAPEAELTLVVSDGARELGSRRVTLRRADADRADAAGGVGPVAVTWAQAQAERLGLFPEKHEAELLALGRRFGVVTAGTSLLVLETLQQHLQYGVEPAATRPELRAQYLAAAAEQRKVRKVADHDALEAVVAAWKERVAWWERKYDVPEGWRWREGAPRKSRAMERLRRAHDGDGDADDRELAMPSMAAPPAPAAEAAGKAKGDGGEGGRGTEASIAIQPWDPRVPWLAALEAATAGQAYDAYLAEKAKRAGPGFYLDCAGWFLKHGERALGLRVLTNLAELRLDDAALLRVLAWRLSEAGELDPAVEVLEKVLRLRPEEPQSRRDLALVLADRAEARSRPADAARAAALLWDVGQKAWPGTVDIEIVSLLELNRILARAGRRGWSEVAQAAPVDPRLRKNLELDVRISLSWDADRTDVDLHVLEPTAEHAFYDHRETRMGGLVSHDVTTGYGPEEYVLRRALPGSYDVRVRYYGSGQQTLIGPATLIATVYTNWGRPTEQRQILTLRLDQPRDLERIGVVKIGPQGALVRE